MAAFELRLVETVCFEDQIALYRDAGWLEEGDSEDPKYYSRLVKQSYLFAAVFDGNKMIGMGRVLSDGLSDAYIQDVVVLRSYRGQGLGKKIIQLLVDTLKSQKISWIGLIGEPGTRGFYEGLGFKDLTNYIPMRYSNK